jgi:glycosyltransferase involved in cell wall biosynthesis
MGAQQSERLAFLLDNLSGGGAEQVVLNLAAEFVELGYRVDLLVCKLEGNLVKKIPPGINVVRLESHSAVQGLFSAMRADPGGALMLLGAFVRSGKVPGALGFMPAIADYLGENQVQALVSALPKSNINAVLAKQLAGSNVRVIVGVHIHLTMLESAGWSSGKARMRNLRPLMSRYYRQADGIVAVSRGVAEDAADYLNIPAHEVVTIYNPIAIDEVFRLSKEALSHEWLVDGSVPVVLGIGRLVEQKNFPLLVRAFASVRKNRRVRLIILGGDESSPRQCRHKRELFDLASSLGVSEDFDMPGYVSNPYAYLSRAALFVLSSRFEGFGNVLIEALLCGCPVVSTDCPSGPAEILLDDRYGRLVPVDDEEALADAMTSMLDCPPDEEVLRARGKEFSVSHAVELYADVMLGARTE